MKIETKYDIGQEGWFYIGNQPIKGEVGGFDISASEKRTVIRYDVFTDTELYSIQESELFSTKEELLKV